MALGILADAEVVDLQGGAGLGAGMPLDLGDVGPQGSSSKSWCAGERLKAQENLGALRNELKAVHGKMLKEQNRRVKAESQMTSLKSLVQEQATSKACAGKMEAMQKLARVENRAAAAAAGAEAQLKWYKEQVATLNKMQKRMQAHLVAKVRTNVESDKLAKVVLYGASTKKSTKAASDTIKKFMSSMATADKKAVKVGGAAQAMQVAALVAKNVQLEAKLKDGTKKTAKPKKVAAKGKKAVKGGKKKAAKAKPKA